MHTRLPDAVITSLYKDALIFVTEPASKQEPPQFTNNTGNPAPATPPPVKKWYLGDNKKHIVFVVHDANAVFINDEWLSTLVKLITACKLNMGDVAIVNNASTAVTFGTIKEKLQPTNLFLFGLSAGDLQLPFTIPHYQVQQFSGCAIMTVPSETLSAQNTDALKTEKRKLWEKLKQVFQL